MPEGYPHDRTPPRARPTVRPGGRVGAPPPVLGGTANPPPLRPPPVSVLQPSDLEPFRDLLLFAQTTVDGFFAGKHRSPHPGASAEFRDFRNYTPGDAIDRLDWRAYGRSRRLFVRRYEDETDMVAYLLVDCSGSMGFAGPGRVPKYWVAARIAAAIAYLMLHQGDKAALGLFAHELVRYLPPSGTRRQLHEMVRALEQVSPARTTGIDAALRQCAGYFKKRGRLVVISDFLGPQQGLIDALSRFLHRRFSILLLQVLDPDEVHLPAATVARFVDLESGEQVEVDTAEIGAAYRRRVEASLRDLARESEARRIEYQRVDTVSPYTSALEAYLGFRRAGR